MYAKSRDHNETLDMMGSENNTILNRVYDSVLKAPSKNQSGPSDYVYNGSNSARSYQMSSAQDSTIKVTSHRSGKGSEKINKTLAKIGDIQRKLTLSLADSESNDTRFEKE